MNLFYEEIAGSSLTQDIVNKLLKILIMTVKAIFWSRSGVSCLQRFGEAFADAVCQRDRLVALSLSLEQLVAPILLDACRPRTFTENFS